MEKTKEEIIETLGLHLEKEHNLPPLAARIYAILILTDEDGITFEDCLEKRGASKSSTSTSLNLLLNMGLVTYFTKPSDRRRYFTTAKKKNFFLSKLQENLSRMETEKSIITLVLGYHKKNSPKKYEEGQVRTKVYLDYVSDNEKILKKSIKKLESIIDE
ncbi:transcriptional regulator [Flagellimonas halotolerans]|uniref:Transcriptional regulator n=1 Tax=Flagellimonas halotolerans TaxID=3112164 RepID=A0ABU6ITW6_9FLAO|nr:MULTISPECIES: transcriptional regulator [unclassified Allomuricauda]MEC3966685.1 transcriptional regulator [Muricauda sp. SYSU M86414]MEC4266509.1 transcriptional regulator [Muricauda sp. SYSU M84420]